VPKGTKSTPCPAKAERSEAPLPSGPSTVDHDHIGFGHIHVKPRERAEANRQVMCPSMVVPQAPTMVLDRVKTRCSQDTSLAHLPSEAAPDPPRPLHGVRWSSQHRADWCPQSFGKADHDRVHGFHEIPLRSPQCRGGVPESGPVQMDGESRGPGNLGHGSGLFGRQHRPPGIEVRVFERQHSGSRLEPGRESKRRPDRLLREAPLVGFHHPEKHPPVRRDRPLLVMDQMGPTPDKDLITRTPLGEKCGLIGHDPRRKQKRTLLTEKAGHRSLKDFDRGILPIAVIADRSLRHRRPHRMGRLGDRIRTKIDHGSTILLTHGPVLLRRSVAPAPQGRWRAPRHPPPSCRRGRGRNRRGF
jgi:hypothetical protein